DRFENGDSDMSDSGLDVAIIAANASEAPNGGGNFFNNSHRTNVLVLELTQDQNGSFPDSIEWCFSCVARQALTAATSITFRIGFERSENDQCEGEVYPVPGLVLRVLTESGGVPIDVSQYARLALPDTAFETDVCSGQGDGCQTFNAMQA